MHERRPLKMMLGIAVLLAACGGTESGTADAVAEVQAPPPMPAATGGGAESEMAEGFASVFRPYAEIGRALSEDRTETVAEAARRLEDAALALEAELTAELAGVPEADLESVRRLLPDLADSAVACAESADLTAARAAFEKLSRMMVSYRDLQVGETPVVAYCPMVNAEWLQSGEEIVNPYYGSEMLRCGEVVRR